MERGMDLEREREREREIKIGQHNLEVLFLDG